MSAGEDESRGVKPAAGAPPVSIQPAIGDTVGPARAARAAIVDRRESLCRVERQAGLRRQRAVELPAAEHLPRESTFSAIERQLPQPGGGGALTLVGFG